MESSDNAPQGDKPQDEHMGGSEAKKESDNLPASSTQILAELALSL